MKLLNIATILAVVGTSAAYAQAMVEDSDGDGVYSMDELKVSFPDLTEDIFAQVDLNADGAVDVNELAAAQDAGVLPS